MTIQQAFELAAQYRNAGQRAEAESIYRQILAAQPNQPDALHNLGVLAIESGDSQAAIKLIEQAIALQPVTAHYHGNLGIALRNSGRIDEAVLAYRRAISLDSRDPSIWYNLGNALSVLEQLPQAIEAYQNAIRLKPDYVDAHHNLGNTFNQLGQADQAIAAYRRALALKPDLASAQYSLGVMLLRQGDFAPGWRGYESRWDIPGLGLTRAKLPQPMWDGSDLTGRHIFIHSEQGLGDTIQIARYGSLLKKLGASRITLACQPDAFRLMRTVPAIDTVITDGDPIPPSDVHCPLMSLPMLCKTTLQTIPAEIPYVSVEPQQVDRWRERIGNAPGRKIGLVWAGRPTHLRDRIRSITLSTLSPLGQVLGIRFFSLQKGKASEQTASPPQGMNLTNWTSELRDFSDTAALIQNLDLVIAVDTSVAHLAGAMGKPVWVLLPYVPDWRWLLDRTDSPWYPTMRLFRQPHLGDWGSVITQVAQSL